MFNKVGESGVLGDDNRKSGTAALKNFLFFFQGLI